MLDYAQLPKILRGLRQNRGFSQQNMAEALHVSRSTYSYWEEGKTRPSVEVLQGIAEVFSVPAESFFYPECYEKMGTKSGRTGRRWTEEVDLVGHLSPGERRLIAMLRSLNALDLCMEAMQCCQC